MAASRACKRERVRDIRLAGIAAGTQFINISPFDQCTHRPYRHVSKVYLIHAGDRITPLSFAYLSQSAASSATFFGLASARLCSAVGSWVRLYSSQLPVAFTVVRAAAIEITIGNVVADAQAIAVDDEAIADLDLLAAGRKVHAVLAERREQAALAKHRTPLSP